MVDDVGREVVNTESAGSRAASLETSGDNYSAPSFVWAAASVGIASPQALRRWPPSGGREADSRGPPVAPQGDDTPRKGKMVWTVARRRPRARRPCHAHQSQAGMAVVYLSHCLLAYQARSRRRGVAPNVLRHPAQPPGCGRFPRPAILKPRPPTGRPLRHTRASPPRTGLRSSSSSRPCRNRNQGSCRSARAEATSTLTGRSSRGRRSW